MGEICDQKVLHNEVYTLKLLFDPLCAKFILKIKNFLKNAVYIVKTYISYYIMAMKKLSEYKGPEEVMQEIQKRFPVLTYRKEDDNYYTMLYYGMLPDPDVYMLVSEFIRIYYTNDMKTYHYIACIGGRESEESIVCNDKTVEEVIEMFKIDIEKSKKSIAKRRMWKLNEDF